MTEEDLAGSIAGQANGFVSKKVNPKPLFTPQVYAASGSELVIEIEPMGAPRVTRNSRWGNKKVEGAIERYDVLKAKIKGDCALLGYKLSGKLTVRFELTMPKSWSKKDRDLHRGRPHQSKPDLDNMIKAVMDAFGADDSHVHTITASKIWAEKGRIVITR
jgi:Holliday junction resolvase RusA-like endonuclease